MVSAAIARHDRNIELLQQGEQVAVVEFPGEGEAQDINPGRQRLMAIGKQPADPEVCSAGQGSPNHLVAQTGNAHAVLVGKSEDYRQRIVVGRRGLKQQGFVLKRKGGHGQG